MQYASKGVTMMVACSFLLTAAGAGEAAGATPAAAQDGDAGAAAPAPAQANAPGSGPAPINLGEAVSAPVTATSPAATPGTATYPAASSAGVTGAAVAPGLVTYPTASPAGVTGMAAAPATVTSPATASANPGGPPAAAVPSPASESLDQLVAPIALYPDQLVTQIMAAAAYPAQVVEADRWVQQNPDLADGALAQAIDQLPWDASVKALVAFPAVLANMDQNLAWTDALGQAYAGQPQAVFNAVQDMRRRAQQAGTLQSTAEQTVTTEGASIAIAPASPETVYVPEYDPWLAYGAPVAAYPYWDPYPGLYLEEPGFMFGLGVGIGVFAGFGWGWGHWGADWNHGWLLHDHRVWGPMAGGRFAHGGFAAGGLHGFQGGYRPGGFVGFDHGMVGRGFAAAGRPGGAGGFRDGAVREGGGVGGGFHGGGGHR